MPVYLCKPGWEAQEPWRHGVQVYAFPFDISSDSNPGTTTEEDSHDEVVVRGDDAAAVSDEREPPEQPRIDENHDNQEQVVQHHEPGVSIRRIRHAEVVLVDDVCIAHDRYWLRLQWPGPKGGFAGYIALGSAISVPPPRQPQRANSSSRVLRSRSSVSASASDDMIPLEDTPAEETGGYLAHTAPTVLDDTLSPPHRDGDAVCLRTGLYFPSSSAMKLMELYDDGLKTESGHEPVFCRICREGLHDVENDETPAGAVDDGGNEVIGPSSPRDDDDDEEEEAVIDEADEAILLSDPVGPELPPPKYHANKAATENPLLAPCECSGSMAFVHYLCVEQWRCRSRHPEARFGLNCETCGSAYALPPPSSRPPRVTPMDEDWLDGMPPNVVHALRHPHFFWQVSCFIVRRKWVRPFAPVVLSPLVALYCRARRLLKKRGVSRRRWACSLCRRRARWKCVRCLRSYYCSRQCQNVSWHIVHKHVCYKPMRFWTSVVVYGSLTVAVFPGILKDPLIYDLGLTLLPASFLVMGILGGGIATVCKKSLGVDMRGRSLEFFVLLMTLWLVTVSWGLVWAFFGFPESCHGVTGTYVQTPESHSLIMMILRRVIFQGGQRWFMAWDRLALNSTSWLRKGLCSNVNPEKCFAHISNADPDFFFAPEGAKCAADLVLVSNLWMLALVTLCVSSILKKRDRLRRAAARVRRHNNRQPLEQRPHQD